MKVQVNSFIRHPCFVEEKGDRMVRQGDFIASRPHPHVKSAEYLQQ